MKRIFWLSLVGVLCGGVLLAQRGSRRFLDFYDGDEPGRRRTAREYPSTSRNGPGVPDPWTNAVGFEKDVFTFARVSYQSGGFGSSRGGWRTDLPDSDINLSYRLQQVTALRVDPDGRIVNLTDQDLYRFPFIYIVEPGALSFSSTEAAALRKHLLNGGFLWLDDFWGDSAWLNVERRMREVFPDRSFTELDLSHPIYHCVFEIKAKHQVPAIDVGESSRVTGVTWERGHDGDVRTVHHKAIFDDKGRLMVLATHNTDNGDGWEREGESEYYFQEFSEKTAYPLAINVLYYVMTH